MNVNDFQVPIPDGDKLHIIFSHQLELMRKYHLVEEKNLGRHLPNPENIELDSSEDQLRLKEFAWRITEELAEATECLSDHDDESFDPTHFLEELVDALHFSVEFCMMSWISSHDILSQTRSPAGSNSDYLQELYHLWETHSRGVTTMKPGTPGFRSYFYLVAWQAIEFLGRAMNTLKNKPWKSTHMVTDKQEYRRLAIEFMKHLFILMWVAGLNPLTLTQLYLNKNAVNKFRIRSNY